MYNHHSISTRTADQISTAKRVHDIVSTMAYLVGVPECMLDKSSLKMEVFHKLHMQPEARVIRTLCQIRCQLMRNYDAISYEMYNMRNLDLQHEYFDSNWFGFLIEQRIPFIKPNCRVNSYIADTKRYLLERISLCRELFPIWIEWNYVRELFLMPDGIKETGIKKAAFHYLNNLGCYPYQMYLNWSVAEQGNIFLHDGKFVHLLYQAHGQRFNDFSKVQDASTAVINGIQEYITEHESITLLVDCENTDPYKFCAAIRSIAMHCGDDIKHIQKIALIDDIHSASAWTVLHKYIDIPIERQLVRRVSDYKSLVDMSLATYACKEVYKNGTDALIIASSDSDFWGLITALTDVSFFVMAEQDKCGEALKSNLMEASIPFCIMDSFTSGGISDMKEGALFSEIRTTLERSIFLNIHTMLADAFRQARITMTDVEKRNFVRKMYGKLRLRVDQNGDVLISCD